MVFLNWQKLIISITFRNNSVAPIEQLLAGLRFYASAGHLATIADFIGMDISTASRIIAKVTLAIARLYPRFVKMPAPEELVQTQSDFHHIALFPRVIGCVDETHVMIQSPGRPTKQLCGRPQDRGSTTHTVWKSITQHCLNKGRNNETHIRHGV